ncbi:SGNH/GDSL hydrolase family protein [Deinococcus humi]|uniref:Lysophospholipase L1-like esterase n=1 Tax=Deinococcus humi TaxID=662880 RepID=A0A7W8NE09_9DEIO|nr:hypothetical protein [Deinococcus humi]MBB5361318.1 lysophospholipase L1-like esterase [Deinococcus humi]GGO19457.1 hypothetical protein GCM10008949_03830 [Deinococcus humi]
MTRLVGIPDVAAASSLPLSATLIWTHEYRRGDRLGMGSVPLTYDRDAGKWMHNGAEFDLLAARFGMSDPAPPNIRILFTLGSGSTVQGTSLTLTPIENAAGVLDLTKPLNVASWVTGTAYQSLLTQQQTAIANLNAFSVQGQAVAQSLADVTGELDGVLADVSAVLGVAAPAVQIAQAVGVRVPLLENVFASAVSEGVMLYGTMGSTFADYGFPIGPRAALDRLSITVQPVTAPLTSLRLQIVEATKAGAVLHNQTFAVNAPVGVPTRLTLDTSALVGDGTKKLYAILRGNTPFGIAFATNTLFTTAGGYPAFAYGYNTDLADATLNDAAGGQINYTPWFQASKRNYPAGTVTPASAWTDITNTLLSGPRELLPLVGEVQPTLGTLVQETLTSSAIVSFAALANVFSAYTFPIGTPTNFDYIEFGNTPGNPAKLPTVLHWQIVVTGTGAVLLDVRKTLSNVAAGVEIVTRHKAPALLNPGGAALEIRISTDGYIGYRGTFAGGATNGAKYNSGTPNPDAWAATAFSGSGVLWLRLGVASGVKQLALAPAFAGGLKTEVLKTADDDLFMPTLSLPSVLYATEGQTFQLYYDTILRTPGLDLSPYDVDFSVTGLALASHNRDARHFWWTPTGAEAATASYAATLRVHRKGKLLASATTTIRMTTTAGGVGTARKLLALSDSITNRGVWLSEMVRLSERPADPLTLTSIGTRAGTQVPVGLPAVMSEGWEGKTITFHYRDAASNFTFNGADPTGTAFSLSQYLTANGLSMASGDAFEVMLGTNDLTTSDVYHTTEAAALATIAGMVSDLNAIIANVQAAVPGIRVVIATNIPPARVDFIHMRRWIRYLWAERIFSTYGGRESEGIYVCPVAQAVDPDYGFPFELRAANTRTDGTLPTLPYITDYLHPNVPGYYQMADAHYAFYKWLWRV